MSIRIMTQVWELDLQDSEMLIMLAMADWSNDDGECWPSIAQIARKTRKGERTVQGAIKAISAKGHLTRMERPGKGCLYKLHPRNDCTPQPLRPAESAPPQRTTRTPAAAAPNTSRHTKSSEAKASSVKRASAPDAFPRPDGVDAQHWADFLENRKRKRLPNTATAHKRLMDDLDRYSSNEWPPGRILQHAAERGWAGIYDPRESRGNGHGQRTGFKHDGKPSGWAPRPGMDGAEPFSLDD